MVRPLGHELHLRNVVGAHGPRASARQVRAMKRWRRAVRWLCERQNADGGWGESNDTYAQAPAERRPAASTSFQSAWALLGLMAAGQVQSRCRGTRYRLPAANPERARVVE